VNGGQYRDLAEQNRVLRLPVEAERGTIVDRNGKVLARNLPGFAVTVIPFDGPRAEQSDLAERLAPPAARAAEGVGSASGAQRARVPIRAIPSRAVRLARDRARCGTARDQTARVLGAVHREQRGAHDR